METSWSYSFRVLEKMHQTEPQGSTSWRGMCWEWYVLKAVVFSNVKFVADWTKYD